jgi:UDP-4-amino-4-deoxy-L-arabinose formyltransferase/UDP-glucuronic acid dehydrogenase (UDP-4-keto-hexauronic acid decarboxylating)
VVAERRLRVVVIAEEAAGVQVLRGLMALPMPPEIVAVLTRSSTEGAERPVVYESAQNLGLDIWPSSSVKSPDLATRLRNAKVDLLMNVHSLFLIHPSVLAAPTIGSFNLHPGPLPEYAGLNVPSWAIYEGARSHGVTVHWLDEGVDTGPIAWQERFDVDSTDTGLALSGKCVRLGVPLVLRLATVAATDASLIPREQQDLSRRRYFSAGPPAEGRFDWAQPADAILRFIRAADYAPFDSPWGHPRAQLAGVCVGVAKAKATGEVARQPPGTVVELIDSGAVVATADELIVVQRLWLDGRYLKPKELLAD